MAGEARTGMARHGKVRQGVARQARLGSDWHGEAGQGTVRSGAVWQGMAGEAWNINRKELFKMAAYKWKTASYIKADAEKAGKMCEELERTGGLTAERLVEANEPEDAPLHDEFEWNDEKAAGEWRKQQARHIINSLVIVSEKQDAEPVRAFISIERASPNYESLDVIIHSEDKYAALLAMALKELEAFKKKYSQLAELNALFDIINELKAKEKIA
jgi:hypothetical protein